MSHKKKISCNFLSVAIALAILILKCIDSVDISVPTIKVKEVLYPDTQRWNPSKTSSSSLISNREMSRVGTWEHAGVQSVRGAYLRVFVLGSLGPAEIETSSHMAGKDSFTPTQIRPSLSLSSRGCRCGAAAQRRGREELLGEEEESGVHKWKFRLNGTKWYLEYHPDPENQLWCH
jgi:hypothetical protein